MNKIFNKLNAYWDKMGWDFKKKSTLLAVSGGKDSMLLAEVFRTLEFNLIVAHVNYKLRGIASNEDALFVENYCQRWGIKYYIKELPVSNNPEKNTQIAARNLRYNWFYELCQKNSFDYIGTAHHLQDSVETLFINMGRGTGLNGMLGIPAMRENIVRPLSVLTPEEMKSLIGHFKIEWRTDSSNLSEKYLRNKLRHQVIPKLDEIFPTFYKTQLDNFIRLNSDKNLVDELVEIYRDKIYSVREDLFLYNLKKIESHSERTTLLFHLLSDWNFNIHQIRQIWYSYHHQDGGVFLSQNGKATIRNNMLQICQNRSLEQLEISISKETSFVSLPNYSLTLEKVSIPNKFEDDPKIAFLDIDKLEWPITIKYWEAGDSFQPLGMNGKHQKLQDFFSNNKYSVLEKERQALLWSGDQLVWIVAKRLSQFAAISSTTTSCLKITCTDSD